MDSREGSREPSSTANMTENPLEIFWKLRNSGRVSSAAAVEGL
ncbi:MAG: hypothetical protein ABEJ87_05230 [Candidatus Nanohalobium sp.]